MTRWNYCCVKCRHLFATDGEFSSCPSCGQWCQSHDFVIEDDARLAAIEKLCRANNNPSVNVATHALANRILKIIEGKEQEA